jgi:hypothetical protein
MLLLRSQLHWQPNPSRVAAECLWAASTWPVFLFASAAGHCALGRALQRPGEGRDSAPLAASELTAHDQIYL